MLANSTIITSCFHLEKYYEEDKKKFSRTINEMIYENGDFLLSMPAYMIIFCDEFTYPEIFKLRNEQYDLGHLTKYHVMRFEDIWAYQYKDKVIQNRENLSTYATDLNRRNWCVHLLVCNAYDFIENAIKENPFNTNSFLYTGINIYKIINNHRTKNEEYQYFNKTAKLNFLKILHNIPEKFHINFMGVIDKKYLKDENLNEFYQKKRFFVSGGIITFQNNKKNLEIIADIKSNFLKHLNLGYGYGDEMLYVDILHKHYDDIQKSYGDYHDIINNYFQMKTNQKYIIDYIIKPNFNFKYYKECIDVCDYFLNSIEEQAIDLNFEYYFYVLFTKYVSAYYLDKELAKATLSKIIKNIEDFPSFKKIYLNKKDFYDKQFSYIIL